MQGFWTIFGVVLTGALWRSSGLGEWTVPRGFEDKILAWKKKWYWSQIILRVMSDVPVEELEQFAWSLGRELPKLEKELGVPLFVEIEWKGPLETSDPVESCLTRVDRVCQGTSFASTEGVDDQGESREVDNKTVHENLCDNPHGDLHFSCLSRRFPELYWLGQAECK